MNTVDKVLKFFKDNPHLEASDAMLRPRDGITYADLWDLLCQVMDQD